MASVPTVPLAPVDEYLNTSYEHDMEFVDGVLVERGMPTIPHSLLQKLLLFWFAPFENPMRFEALQEVRTQIIERARYRVPDILLCPKPFPKGKVCDIVPWAVVEVVSPDDTINKTRARFLDYSRIGVQQLVLMDPEEFVAHRFEDGSLIQTQFKEIRIDRGNPPLITIPFDSDALFEQLKAKLAEE